VGQFTAAIAGRLSQLNAAFTGSLTVIRAALAGGFGPLGTAFAHGFRKLVAALSCALARGLHNGRAPFGGRAGQFTAPLRTYLKAVRDSFAQLGFKEAAVGAIQRKRLRNPPGGLTASPSQ